MEKKKAFHSWDIGRFHLNFPNGNHLSTIFAEGTYSENYNSRAMSSYLFDRTKKRPAFSSDNCEIMFECPEELKKKILEKYNGGEVDPIGYLPQDKWLEIVNLLAESPLS